jgi:hypothetical protein
MHRRYGLLILLSAITVTTTLYACYKNFQPQPQLPFTVRWADAHHALVEPIPGLTPPSVHAGDRLDLNVQSHATRIALVTSGVTNLPASASYSLVIGHGATQVSVIVHTVDGNSGGLANWADWLSAYELILLCLIALLALWRGHDRSALGMAFWAMTEGPLAGAIEYITPGGSRIALLGLIAYFAFSLMARIGFFVMAESIASSAIAPLARARWRGLFTLVLGTATAVTVGGRSAVVVTGWAGLMQPWLQWFVVGSYLVPVALLAVTHRHADAKQRQRLRWLLWGSVLFVGGLFFFDLPLPLNYLVIDSLNLGLVTLGGMAFLYAVLRHRVVDITVAINRALVYALTTSLVLGLFALFESLVERSALGHRESLALDLAVPLALGVSLSTVHRRIDALVDRLIFRRQYRAEMALRRFGNESAFVSAPQTLLDLTVEQILLHAGATWVALYEYTPEGYRRSRQRGEHTLPETVPTDDLALVRLRAHDREVDLHEASSALGREGHVFPLRVRDHLLGVLVLGPRPGEHYAAEERELMGHVAHAVGASLFALRARATEEELSAARSEIEASAARLDAARTELDQAHDRRRASEAREAKLLDALSARG